MTVAPFCSIIITVIIIIIERRAQMANLKYSRQREAIKDYLSSVTKAFGAATAVME